MRRLVLALIALIALALAAVAQTKHPFTFEDMMKLKRVGDPQVSPDGKWVLFSVVDVSLEANTKTPHIWIVPLGGNEEKSGVPHVSRPLRDVGGTERELIPDQDADRARWAPDGKRFAFLSNKEGGSQIWIADFDGVVGTVTALHKLTSISTETGGELWSRDGKNILFTSDVYPECDGAPAEEAACNAKKLEEHEKSKVKALIFDHLLYRHWNAYKEGKRSHIFVIEVPRGDASVTIVTHILSVPRDLTPGDYDAPVFSLGGQDNYAFSPDGQEICYTSNHDKNEAASTNNDLWIVPVSGGPAKNITADNPASDLSPLYSPDGRYIAYRAQQRPGYESDRFRLMLYDRKTGEKKNLTESFDHWVGSFAWAPDSKMLYFSAEHKRHSLIYAIGGFSSTATSIRTLVAGFNDDVAVTPDGKKLIFSRNSIAAPNEIYGADATVEGCPSQTGDVDRGKESCSLSKDLAVTHVNERLLSQVATSTAEPFWFKGAKGDDVEGSMVKPPNFMPARSIP